MGRIQCALKGETSLNKVESWNFLEFSELALFGFFTRIDVCRLLRKMIFFVVIYSSGKNVSWFDLIKRKILDFIELD